MLKHWEQTAEREREEARAFWLLRSFGLVDQQRLCTVWLRLKAQEEAGHNLTTFQRACWRVAEAETEPRHSATDSSSHYESTT